MADAIDWVTAQEAADPARPWFAWVACNDYSNGTWSPANAEWHYCRLSEVVAMQSFF